MFLAVCRSAKETVSEERSGGNCAAEECVVVEDSYFPEVTWVVPHRDVFPDVRGEDWGEVSGGCETDPVTLHTAGCRCGE